MVTSRGEATHCVARYGLFRAVVRPVAARQIGTQARRGAAQQAIIALERQHGQRRRLRPRARRVMPPGPIVNSRVTNWLALPRALATVMARCSVLPSSTKFSRMMLSTMELTGNPA